MGRRLELWSRWERMRPKLSWTCGWKEGEGQREAVQEGWSQRLMAVKEDKEGKGQGQHMGLTQ